MATVRNRVVKQLCDLVGAERGVKFVSDDNLPKRAVFDLEETNKKQFGAENPAIEVVVESLLDAGQTPEGDVLDAELGVLQKTLLNDFSIQDIDVSVLYVGCIYSYSENGSSVVGLAATFNVGYSFLSSDPSMPA